MHCPSHHDQQRHYIYQIDLNYIVCLAEHDCWWIVEEFVTDLINPKHSAVTQISVYPTLVLCTQLSCGITLQDSALGFVHPQVLLVLFCMLFTVNWTFLCRCYWLLCLTTMHFIPLVKWTRFTIFCVNHLSVTLLIILYTLTEMLNEVVSAIKSGYNHWVQSDMVFPRIGFHFIFTNIL